MKKAFLILFLLLYLNISAQKINLEILSLNKTEQKTIDSLSYLKQHTNIKSLLNEIELFSNKLNNTGFINFQIIKKEKKNDSTFIYLFDLEKKTRAIKIKISKTDIDFVKNYKVINDSISIPFHESESFLKKVTLNLENKGFSLAEAKLINITKTSDILIADLNITLHTKRKLDKIIINGYENFPKNHLTKIQNHYKNKIYNQKLLDNIYKDFEKINFTKNTKYPEILFTKDSTYIYVYIEKVKSNNFDGFIGFANSQENTITLNGYLDLSLINIINSGEKLNLLWKSNGEEQRNFNLNIETPYLFKSPFSLKSQLNIFKQDSTFQNTNTKINLGYFLKYNTRFYLGYQTTESNDIRNQNSTSISDFKNNFKSFSFEYINKSTFNELFPDKTKIEIDLGIGNRNSKNSENKQSYIHLLLQHDFYFNSKNLFHIKSQNKYLTSNLYLTNELYRFGGINTIRGFNENILQGNFYSIINTEYRHLFNPNLYIHSIIDFCTFQDKTINQNSKLYSFGTGLGLLTKNGLFNLIYANGNTKGSEFKLSNSLVHLSYNVKF